VRKYKAGAGEKRPERRIFGPFLGLTVLLPSQRRHTRNGGLASSSTHLQFILQRDLLEVGDQRVDLHPPAAGKRQRDTADMPIAVRPERGATLHRLDAALRQTQDQRRLLGRQQSRI